MEQTNEQMNRPNVCGYLHTFIHLCMNSAETNLIVPLPYADCIGLGRFLRFAF